MGQRVKGLNVNQCINRKSKYTAVGLSSFLDTGLK